MNHNAGKTHCVHGHEFTEENIYTPPGTTKRMCMVCRRESVKRSSLKHREKRLSRQRLARKNETSEAKREKNLKYIGWSTDRFDVVFKEQEGKCAICKKPLTLEKRISGSRACADHKHSKPPVPRGILCANCNLGIGNLQDDPKIMEAAIAYVEKWR